MKLKGHRFKFIISFVIYDLFFLSLSISLGAIINVPADQPTIQAGIDAATAGDSVLIANGTFTGIGNKNLDLLGKAIELKSENGPLHTTIDCENDGRGFYIHSGEGEDTILKGFTIKNCTDSFGGGGIYCNSASPTIDKFILKNNTAGSGGGIFLHNSSAVVKNCRIEDNTAITSAGGGIRCQNTTFSGFSPTITNCKILNNKSELGGGGISIGSDSFPTITRCIISNNEARAGGGIEVNASSPSITNCFIAGNTTTLASGGGISWAGDALPPNNNNAELIHNTIADNYSLNGTGIYISSSESPPIITNCIIWDNYNRSEIFISNTNLTVRYSNYRDSIGGDGNLIWAPGNLHTDPLFIEGGNYHLGQDSPCKDRGIVVTSINRDIDYDARPFGSNPDMGADEYTGIFTGRYNLSNISTVSDEFQLWTDISINDQVPTDICNNYTFFVKTDDEIVQTSQLNCQSMGTDSTQIPNSNRYRIWFKINSNTSHQNAAYFEEGKIYICSKSDPSVCARLKDLSDFSVYGTTFDLTKHAWQFRNRSWNTPSSLELFGVGWSEDTYKAADIIDDYIWEQKRKDFWESIGMSSTDIFPLNADSSIIKFDSKGACYGLVHSAISNFMHVNDEQSWGNGNIEDWYTEIENNWDNIGETAVSPYKPFQADQIFSNRETYDSNDRWTYQSAKKIMYYHVSQPFFTGSNWAGEDLSKIFSENSAINILKSGSPISLGIRGANFGHRVAITQSILWNDHAKHIIWDNEYPYPDQKEGYGPFLEWYVEQDKNYFSADKICYVYMNDGNGWHLPPKYTLTSIPMQLEMGGETDSQNIYNLWSQIIDQDLSLKPLESEPLNSQINYDYNNHIEILIIGAEINSVQYNDSHLPVTLIPNGEIKNDNATIIRSGKSFFTHLYLPANSEYLINASEDNEYIGARVYVTIPYVDGTVERINYESLETDENDEMQFHFTVGRSNSDLSIRRIVNGMPTDDYQYDYYANLPIQINSPRNFSALFENGYVKLNWSNDNNPNLASVVIVRKESDFPALPNDGTVIFNSNGVEVIDSGVDSNSTYYYSAFSVDSSGGYSDPIYTVVNTELLSLYGYVRLSSGEGVENIELGLIDIDGK